MDMSIYYYDDELDSSEDPLSMPGTPKRAPCSSSGLRRGKWTDEEQAYAAQLIHDFEAGLLPLKNGTTLRAFLAKKLNCGPMRISKKYHGNQSIGKQVFVACSPRAAPNESELKRLEDAFLRSVTAGSKVDTKSRKRHNTSAKSDGPRAKRACSPFDCEMDDLELDLGLGDSKTGASAPREAPRPRRLPRNPTQPVGGGGGLTRSLGSTGSFAFGDTGLIYLLEEPVAPPHPQDGSGESAGSHGSESSFSDANDYGLGADGVSDPVAGGGYLSLDAFDATFFGNTEDMNDDMHDVLGVLGEVDQMAPFDAVQPPAPAFQPPALHHAHVAAAAPANVQACNAAAALAPVNDLVRQAPLFPVASRATAPAPRGGLPHPPPQRMVPLELLSDSLPDECSW